MYGIQLVQTRFMLRLFFAALLIAGVLSSPVLAQSPAPSPDQETFEDTGTTTVNDPLEAINRPIAAINRFIRQGLMDPLATVYKTVTPEVAQRVFANVAANLSEPFTVIGAAIGGDLEGAGTATARFIVNTTLGMGGMADVATEAGLQYCREDIGQGLAQQGAEPGAHVVAPILGPSNLRDLPGDLVETIVTPLPISLAKSSVEYAENQEAIKKLTESASDPYVKERDAYELNRLYEISITCKFDDPARKAEGQAQTN